MGTVLEDALKNRAYHLAKNVEDLTPGQIAEVEANPQVYLPEGYIPEAEPPKIRRGRRRVSEPVGEPEPEPAPKE